METVRLERKREPSPRTVTIAIPVDRTSVSVPPAALFTRATSYVRARQPAAWLGGVAASIVFVAYLANGALADDPKRAGGTGETAKAATSSEASSAPQRRNPPIATRTAGSNASVAASPVMFRARIVRAPQGKARDQEAQLSLGDDRLTVAADTSPQNPVFSATYREISAIEHAQEPAWKPPQKLSRVIRVHDDVLDAIGIRDRHSVSLYTKTDDEFIVLRVDERTVGKLLKTLTERTGRDPGRARPR